MRLNFKVLNIFLLVSTIVSAIASAFVAAGFFGGIKTVPDSFLTDLITVDSVAAGITVIALPLAFRIFGVREYWQTVLAPDSLERRRVVSPAGWKLSIILAPTMVVVSLVISVYSALSAVLNADDPSQSSVALFFAAFGYILLFMILLGVFGLSLIQPDPEAHLRRVQDLRDSLTQVRNSIRRLEDSQRAVTDDDSSVWAYVMAFSQLRWNDWGRRFVEDGLDHQLEKETPDLFQNLKSIAQVYDTTFDDVFGDTERNLPYVSLPNNPAFGRRLNENKTVRQTMAETETGINSWLRENA